MATVAAWTFLAAAANPQSPKNKHQISPKKAYPQSGYAFSHHPPNRQYINTIEYMLNYLKMERGSCIYKILNLPLKKK